jgi:hypothetical protein
VAQSTYEAEYYSAADAIKEGLHLRQLMGEIFNAPITETTTIWEDNYTAIPHSKNALVSEKTKHIGLKWHFLKDNVEHGIIKLSYLPLIKWWPTCSPSLSKGRHQQDTEVPSSEEKTQCNASSRSYLQGECCK